MRQIVSSLPVIMNGLPQQRGGSLPSSGPHTISSFQHRKEDSGGYGEEAFKPDGIPSNIPKETVSVFQKKFFCNTRVSFDLLLKRHCQKNLFLDNFAGGYLRFAAVVCA